MPDDRPRPKRRFRGSGLKDVGRVLEAVIAQNRLSRGVRQSKPVVAWAEIAGDQLSRTTRAVAMRDGVLIVEAQDAIAANFLSMQREMFLELYRQRLGKDAPSEIRFQMGVFESPGIKKERQVSKLRHYALPPAERARVDAMLEDAAPDVLPAARKAAEAMARARLERETLGWKPCPVCATLAEYGGPCPHCRNTMANPLVARASKLFVRDPDAALLDSLESLPSLTEDALACARFLALEHLQGQFEVLLLQVIRPKGRGRPKANAADDEVPEMRLYLDLTARAFLSLTLRKSLAEVTRRDRNHLPERVRHALEATEPHS